MKKYKLDFTAEECKPYMKESPNGDYIKYKDYLEEKSKLDVRSWFRSICKDCGCNVIVTQPDVENFPTDDYWWYCSNKKCKNHEKGEHTGDMESPEWVKQDIVYRICR